MYNQHSGCHTQQDEDAVTVDASEIAPLLGLTPERLMAELRAGHVYQSAEEAAEADRGQMRLTFRFRSRVARLIVQDDGSVQPEVCRIH